MHFFVAVLSGCLLQAGDVVSSSASSLCLLKAHQLAGDKAVTISQAELRVLWPTEHTLDTCTRPPPARKPSLFRDSEP